MFSFAATEYIPSTLSAELKLEFIETGGQWFAIGPGMARVRVSVDQWIPSSVYELRGHPFSLVDRHSDSLLLNTLRDDTNRKGRRSGRWSITLPFRFMSLANKAVEETNRKRD